MTNIVTGENRYARQEILQEFGADGQTRLRKAQVLVVGAGGLGCPVLQYLVGAGIGHITLVDPDVVSRTNLHRQTLYQEAQIGLHKVEAARDVLAGLNPECEILPITEGLNADNAPDLVAKADVVLDCADSFATSYILSDACLLQNRPLLSASALGLNGYVGGFCGGAPSLRAVFPELPDRAANCSTAGVMGPVVGAIGALQAQMALSVLLDIQPSPLGQLVTLDCKNFRPGGFRFDNAPEPDCALLSFISVSALKNNDFVVELRGLDEAPMPVTPRAHRYIVADFQNEKLTERPTPGADQRVVLCCRTGLRAWNAARRLQSYWEGEISLIAMGDTPDFT